MCLNISLEACIDSPSSEEEIQQFLNINNTHIQHNVLSTCCALTSLKLKPLALPNSETLAFY